MVESAQKHLEELLSSFDTAMLVTRHGDKENARPMAIAGIEGANTLWFVTSLTSLKADEIRRDSRVSATLQAEKRYVALSGTAELVTDRAKVHALWKPAWKIWFPEGKDDPSIALIRVDVTDAEFWDNSGTKGIRYVFEAGRALVAGERPREVEAQHGRVKIVNGHAPRPR